MAKTIEVNDKNFEDLVQNAPFPVLLHFWSESDWTHPYMVKFLEKVSKKYSDKIKVASLQVDKNRETAGLFSIEEVPSVALLDGYKMVEFFKGAVAPQTYIEKIENLLSEKTGTQEIVKTDSEKLSA